MTTIGTGTSLLSYLSAQTSSTTTDTAGASSSVGSAASARALATSKAALATASGRHQAATAGHVLDTQQAALSKDLRAAMAKAGVKLAGAVEFSVGSDGKLAVDGSDADQAAVTSFLKGDTSKPSFTSRLATLADSAAKLSASIQQSAAISQAARYGGKSAGVMSLYASLMQKSNTTPAVFTVSATSSSLSYTGMLSTTG